MKTAVYTAVINPDIQICSVYPPQRQAEIDGCANDGVRLEKYTAWRLLAVSLKQSMGIDIGSLQFSKNSYGKWTADGCFFSISHSGGSVAVAVSDAPVGVDIEMVKRYRVGIEKMILTPAEMKALEGLDRTAAEEYIIEKWSEKESIFKTLGKKGFQPLDIKAADYPTLSRKIEISENKFILSVCSENIKNTEYYLNTKI